MTNGDIGIVPEYQGEPVTLGPEVEQSNSENARSVDGSPDIRESYTLGNGIALTPITGFYHWLAVVTINPESSGMLSQFLGVK